MIGAQVQLIAVNSANATIQFGTFPGNNIFTVFGQGYKFGTTGKEYTAAQAVFPSPTADVPNGGVVKSTFTIDTVASEEIGMLFTARLETIDAVDGTWDIYQQWSVDGGISYPDSAADFNAQEDLILVGSIMLSGASVRSINFKID